MAISDDVIYGGLLVLSIPFGLVIRRAESWQSRQYISTAIGALIVVAVCGVHTLHSLVTTVINTAIIFLLGPKLVILLLSPCQIDFCGIPLVTAVYASKNSTHRVIFRIVL
jgi:hypothetical protein